MKWSGVTSGFVRSRNAKPARPFVPPQTTPATSLTSVQNNEEIYEMATATFVFGRSILSTINPPFRYFGNLAFSWI